MLAEHKDLKRINILLAMYIYANCIFRDTCHFYLLIKSLLSHFTDNNNGLRTQWGAELPLMWNTSLALSLWLFPFQVGLFIWKPFFTSLSGCVAPTCSYMHDSCLVSVSYLLSTHDQLDKWHGHILTQSLRWWVLCIDLVLRNHP